MTRPQIIRADTIDLQDRISPSAKDHTKQPTHPAALGVGPPAPHQAETLREVAAEVEEEQRRSPRVSNDWNEDDMNDHIHHYGDEQSSSTGINSLTGANLQQQDALAIAQNGGLTGAEDADMADAEGDDGLEDDMLEKMSSSPSIDDGGYSTPQLWPRRLDSLSQVVTPKERSCSSEEWPASSSSPFVETPEHFPLYSPSLYTEAGFSESESEIDSPLNQFVSSYSIGEAGSTYDEESRDVLGPLPNDSLDHVVESYDDDFEIHSTEDLFAVQPDLDLYGCIVDDLDSDVMMIPYESSEEEYDDVPYPEDARFVDSGWGGECLQESEDIDFDLVYALHTFVATVEGQANATKGDTMVLLDDSNSYWWLVRVVKDSSIGYLPAEHIETPTERLARLNKHRNIDLSATMLGDKDLSEKSKNPLKKAIRRRNAKTVTFAAPTYVEASDVEYSSDDEDGEREYFGHVKQVSQQAEQEDVKPSAVEASISNAEVRAIEMETTENVGRMDDTESLKASSEIMRSSDEIFDGKSESNSKSRNGIVRNTDSFFKDDSVETRKITLTPNLLRDDSSSSTRTSNDSKEVRQRATPDKLERDLVLDKSRDDKRKKDKKEKEKDRDKKPGMLSNLFKRNKKGRNADEDADELIYGKKGPVENSRSSPVPSKDSEEFPSEEQAPQSRSSPQRQTSKLQKQPRIEARIEASISKRDAKPDARAAESQPRSAPPERPAPSYSSAGPPLRLVQPDKQQSAQPAQYDKTTPSDGPRDLVDTLDGHGDRKPSGISSQALRARRVAGSETGPEESRNADLRDRPNDFSSSSEVSPADIPVKESAGQATQRPSIPGAYPESYNATPADEKVDTLNDRLSESPVQISPVDAFHSNPPALMVDTSSQEEDPSSTSSPSPELVDADEVRGKKSSENSISTPTSNSTWSDAHLRTFFDDDTDIKDLLVVVYDKSGVVPAGPDHPITGTLFKAENDRLADINNRLNNMLGDWLAQKAKASVAR